MKKSKLTREIEKSRSLYLDKAHTTCLDIIESYKNGEIDMYSYILMMYGKLSVVFDIQQLIRDTDIETIAIKRGEVRAILKSGISLSVDKSCRSAILEILNFGSYEREELKMVSNLLIGSKVVFDIGAHIGWYSLNLATIHKNIEFFAFEPISKTYSYLLKNVQTNSLKNIQTYNFGFSEKERVAEFFYSEIGSAVASERNIFDVQSLGKVHCRLKRIDDFIQEEGIKNIDFLKCDVEGAELLVLRGALASIKNFFPIILLEILEDWCRKFGYCAATVVNFLSDLGYNMFVIKRGKLLKIQQINPDYIGGFNYIFLHPEKHADKISSNT